MRAHMHEQTHESTGMREHAQESTRTRAHVICEHLGEHTYVRNNCPIRVLPFTILLHFVTPRSWCLQHVEEGYPLFL